MIHDEFKALSAGVIVGLLFALGLAMIADPHSRGYRAGQIDALNGVVKYELVTHPDKTTSWEEKQ